ncbi:MAG: hypothetical protein AB1589_38620, partial [Cyanobacteriota bacterium]
MTQGLNQIDDKLKAQLGIRCSDRKRRPRMRDFPPFIPVENLWETQPYSYTDSNGMTQTGEMGSTMVVVLLPRAAEVKAGTPPGGDQLQPITDFLTTRYPQYNFIKGHMWNQEVGGKGETYNLVPLTSKANSAHKNYAETPLKEALISFDSYYANNPQISKAYGFEYRVEIQDMNHGVWPGVAEPIVPNAIYVQASPIEYNARTKKHDKKNSIIEEAVP